MLPYCGYCSRSIGSPLSGVPRSVAYGVVPTELLLQLWLNCFVTSSILRLKGMSLYRINLIIPFLIYVEYWPYVAEAQYSVYDITPCGYPTRRALTKAAAVIRGTTKGYHTTPYGVLSEVSLVQANEVASHK